MIVCPCCGLKFAGDLNLGCPGCRAQPVGEPLPQPERMLPFYGRSIFLFGIGTVMGLILLISTLIALFEVYPLRADFWSVAGAVETAAWRLKFSVIPASFVLFWLSSMLYTGVSRYRNKFAGLNYARIGMVLSAVVPVIFATAIGITVPERLRQRQQSQLAHERAVWWTINAANLEYQAKYHTMAFKLEDLRDKVPDPDGMLGRALDEHPLYEPRSDMAASVISLGTKSPVRRTTVLRSGSLNKTDEATAPGVAITSFELKMPGPDKLNGTDDDVRIADGVVFSGQADSDSVGISKP